MKKNAIIIIVIMLIYLLIMYLFVGKKNLEEQDTYRYLLIDYNTKFKYNNLVWNVMENDDLNGINNVKYSVYQDKKLFGDYNLFFNDKWYLFDDNNNSIKFDSELFAYRGDKKFKFIDYNVEDIVLSDSAIIDKAISQINIDNYEGFVTGKKITIDYDKDNKDEQIYIIKNEINSKPFTIVFFSDGNKITIIDSDIRTQEDIILLKIYNFHSIIDVGLDKKYEIIISQSTFSEYIPYCHYMLYNGRNQDVITSCQKR